MSRKTDHRAIAKLESIYAQLPRVACKGLCSIACGPVAMSELEAARMRKADQARRPPSVHPDHACIYLTESKRCSVYSVRPLICRAWGVVKRMSCMHGCLPDRWLSDHEFVQAGQAIERIGGALVVSALGGLTTGDKSFLDLDTSGCPPELAEAMAERTRVLRALHGGRIAGVTTRATGGEGWIDVKDLRDRRDR